MADGPACDVVEDPVSVTVTILNGAGRPGNARDQCVASVGVRSKVDTTTCSICASVIFRGAPGRGSSESPSNRDSTNRRRHVPTVCGHTPNSAATCLFAFPSAQPSTIRLRKARACDDFARRDQRSNVSRSSSVNTTSATGRPVRATPATYTCGPDFRRRTLEGELALVVVEVLGAEVVDVEHAHGRLEVRIPGGREVHREGQARVRLDGQPALQGADRPVE